MAMIADAVIIGGGIMGVSIAHCFDLKKPRGEEQSCWKRRGGDRGLFLLAKLDKVFDVDRGQINLDDYYEFKEKPDDEFKDIIIEQVNEKLPAFTEGQLVRGWVGLRTVTPDCLLILGEAEVKGSLCAVGFSGAGIQLGPATGQIIADFILNHTPSPYLETLSLRRFLGNKAYV